VGPQEPEYFAAEDTGKRKNQESTALTVDRLEVASWATWGAEPCSEWITLLLTAETSRDCMTWEDSCPISLAR